MHVRNEAPAGGAMYTMADLSKEALALASEATSDYQRFVKLILRPQFCGKCNKVNSDLLTWFSGNRFGTLLPLVI